MTHVGNPPDTLRFQYNGSTVEFSGTPQQVELLRAKVDSGSADRAADGTPILSQHEFLDLLGAEGRTFLNNDLTLNERAFTQAGQRALSEAISTSLGSGRNGGSGVSTLAGRLASLNNRATTETRTESPNAQRLRMQSEIYQMLGLSSEQRINERFAALGLSRDDVPSQLTPMQYAAAQYITSSGLPDDTKAVLLRSIQNHQPVGSDGQRGPSMSDVWNSGGSGGRISQLGNFAPDKPRGGPDDAFGAQGYLYIQNLISGLNTKHSPG
jgi:hypothetical protein